MGQTLRDYQARAKQDLRAQYREGHRSGILVCPTGGGKTTVAASVIYDAIAKAKNAVFLAHRKELIEQCSNRLDDSGIDHGIIKAGNPRVNPSLQVQVASIQTLVRRVVPKDGELLPREKPPVDLFIIDECHRAEAPTYKKVLSYYPNAAILGLTATPHRSDGRGLGDMFDFIVEASTPAELTERGYLVPARVFSTPLLPDFSKVKKKLGDFAQGEVEKLVDRPQLIGDIYGHWKEHAHDRQTVIFAASCIHAQHIARAFLDKGERAEYLDGDTPEEIRSAILARLDSGETQILVNVGILTEGWDNPKVSCVVLARPTESLVLYLQMVGRGLRTLPGEDGWPKERWGERKKKDCIILDHGGNTVRHGFVTEAREWTLEGNKGQKSSHAKLITCPKCYAIFEGRACPDCGTVPKAAEQIRAAMPEQKEGKLQEINQTMQRQEEIRFFHEMLTRQKNNGYKTGYARVKFFERFKRWPGKEHGLKTKWEEYRDEQGTRRFRKLGQFHASNPAEAI